MDMQEAGEGTAGNEQKSPEGVVRRMKVTNAVMKTRGAKNYTGGIQVKRGPWPI